MDCSRDSNILTSYKDVFRTPKREDISFTQQENIRLDSIDFISNLQNELDLKLKKSYHVSTRIEEPKIFSQIHRAALTILTSWLKRKFIGHAFSSLMKLRENSHWRERMCEIYTQTERVGKLVVYRVPQLNVQVKPSEMTMTTFSFEIDGEYSVDIIDDAVEELQRIEDMIESNL